MLRPARRVQLPFGGNDLNINALTAEGATLLRRSIEWAADGASVAPAPSSPENILLVVPDAGSVGSQDLAKRSLFESWGYEVTVISASASQADFDALSASSGAAYVSEEISSSVLGTKLSAAPLGIVNEEIELTDELGLSTSRTWPSANHLYISNGFHYITSTIGSGQVWPVNSSWAYTSPNGTLAPGAQVLASWDGSHNGLTVVEAGAQLTSGTAAGRRVHLPWCGGSFDINSLSDEGLTMTRRAIEWAMGAN